MLASHFKMMSLYNMRMNLQLLSCCSELSVQQLNQNMGSFFPTVLANWNHLLFGDLVMLRRFSDSHIGSLIDGDLEQFPEAVSPDDTYSKKLDEL